ncbi:MAG: DUF4982 domain-containing protein [Lachnospiraceae bacterium]|nr:DUF4982 domain-containing protein [Lachnospiraceae bacterium]
MTNAIESWSWNGCEGKRTRVEVYSRGFRVALFLNGRKLAEKKAGKACRTIFLIKWYPGKLTAAAFDETGKEISRTSLKSAGEDTRLTLFPERETVTAEELCYVRLRYTDSAGERKPLVRGEIRLSVSGGELLGLGSGCPYNEKGFLSDHTDTYYGEALAIIRPKEAGKIEIYAESPYGSARMMVPVL